MKISLHVVVVLILLVVHQLITMPSKSTNKDIGNATTSVILMALCTCGNIKLRGSVAKLSEHNSVSTNVQSAIRVMTL